MKKEKNTVPPSCSECGRFIKHNAREGYDAVNYYIGVCGKSGVGIINPEEKLESCHGAEWPEDCKENNQHIRNKKFEESLAEKARKFAFEKHNQPSKSQRYGSAPYSKHLEDVVAVMKRYLKYLDESEIEDVECACWSHDEVEDTDTTPKLLKQLFNDRIAGIVLAVSNERGWDKKEVLFKTLPKIWQNRLAKFVKLCDRIANTTNSKSGVDDRSAELYERYKYEYPVFKFALKVDGEFDDMWEELDELYYLKK